MSLLTLDLSTKCTGFAIFTKDGKLLKRGQISPDKDINIYFKIRYIVDQIKNLYTGIDELVIEDLYYGVNVQSLLLLARLSGAVVDSWISHKFKLPTFYTASHARKLVGIKGNSHKAEIQLYVINKYKYAPKKAIEEYGCMINQVKNLMFVEKSKKLKTEVEKNERKKILAKYKRQLGKISTLIEEETGVGEDQSDALILGLAFVEENKI